MTRQIGLIGLPDDRDTELNLVVSDGGSVIQSRTLRARAPLRALRYRGEAPLVEPPPPDDDDDDTGGGTTDPGEDDEGTSVPSDDPGNPGDWDETDFIGPSGANVPDLSAIYVTMTRKSGPAPLGVAFQLRSADPNFWAFNLFGTAEWSFSEDPDEDYTFRYLDGDMAGEKAGAAKGPYVCHTYVKPGTHSWSVTLRYPGLSPRTITSTGYLLTRGELSAYLAGNGTDVPAWLGITKGSRSYTMPAVTTGGRINVTMTNGHGTRVLRNILLTDGMTGADVAAAIVAATDRTIQGSQATEARLMGLDFSASGATLTVNSSCPLGTTTLSIGAGDAAGVTWGAGGAPDFSTPAAPGLAQVLYTIPAGITTGGALQYTATNAAGTTDFGLIYFPSGATATDVCFALIERWLRMPAAVTAIGSSTDIDYLRLVYTAAGGTRLRIRTSRALSAITLALATPSTPAGVTWSGGAPDMSATVPAATGAAVTTIAVDDPDTYFSGRTVYCSPAFSTVADFKAAIAANPTLYGNAPSNLADDRYYVGPEAYYLAANARGNLSGTPWRIMLHAGQTYAFDNRDRIPKTVNTYVTRFGTGANPVVTITEAFQPNQNLLRIKDDNQRGGATFSEIDFIGLYDSANPPYSAPWLGALFQMNTQTNYGTTIHGCLIEGWRYGITISAPGCMALVVTDTKMTSWYDFAMYPNHAVASGFAGLALKQKVGTVNVGRKSTAQAAISDRYTFEPAAWYTSKFDWALQAPLGPTPKSGAPAIPTGYEAPTSGGWGTHPAGAAAWDWWRANWASFSWRAANGDAFKNADNDLYRDCAVHGPVRNSTPFYQVGWHQCEFVSRNGWSRSGSYNKNLPDLQQQEGAFAIQPCFRLNTAMGSRGPSVGQSCSIWACSFESGSPAIVAVPEQAYQPSLDQYTRGPGILFDSLIFRAKDEAAGGFIARYGRTALRNSVAIFDGTAIKQDNLIFMGGSSSELPAGSDYNYCFNNTPIFARDLMTVNPSSTWGFARITNRVVGKRMTVEWNNLALRYASIRNSGDYPAAATREPMGDPLGLGRDYLPEANSNALGAATDLAPYYDGAGLVRATPASLGAFDVEAAAPTGPAYLLLAQNGTATINAAPELEVRINGGLWQAIAAAGLTIARGAESDTLVVSGFTGSEASIEFRFEQGEPYAAANSINAIYATTATEVPVLSVLPGIPLSFTTNTVTAS